MTGFNNEVPNARAYYDRLTQVISNLSTELVDDIASRLFAAYQRDNMIFLFGNGGSASLASHFACDLGKGTCDLRSHRKRFRVIALTDNIPTMTAWANDSNYADIFAQQLINLAQPRDIAIGISCSGNSPNVLKGLAAARDCGVTTIGFGGFQGGKMKELCDIALIVPCDNMQMIEDLHLTIAHAAFTLVKSKIEAVQEMSAAAAVG